MKALSGKKKAIFESTLELVREHGFHGTTMSQVAKNADVAAGTIYHYFESKDQLVRELYDFNREQVVRVVDEAIIPEDGYRENFFRIWRKLFRFYVQDTSTLIFFEQFINSPYNTGKNHEHFMGPLYSLFEEAAREKFLKNLKPEIAIVLTMSSITSTAKLSKFGEVPLEEKDLKQIPEILWDGLVQY